MFVKLIPKGKTEKGMRHIISLILLLILIAPFNKGFALNLSMPDFSLNLSQDVKEREYKSLMAENLANVLENDIAEYLISKNIEYYRVSVVTEKSDDDSKISGIVLNIKSGYNPVEIEKMITEKFDLPATIIIGN